MYDAIVIGARCAGSPTAMLLARAGHRVLLVDKATFPSDTMSTHLVHPPGIAAIRRWGLLERLQASGCPPIESYLFDFGPLTISGSPRPVDGLGVAYCPRRTVLDKLLVDAAGQAGAEVCEGFTVEELVTAERAVTGIRGRARDGAVQTERARIVIGADGRHSLVAKAVQPQQYDERPSRCAMYYAYWSGLEVDGFATTMRPEQRRGWAAARTNDGLTIVGVGWPMEEFRRNRSDIEGNYLAALQLDPAFAQRIREARRESRFSGTGETSGYLRAPFGPGWALVGDAGYHKNPVTAMGINDAFRDAELVAQAADDALSGRRSWQDAMSDYQRARDGVVAPVYEFTDQFAQLLPPPPRMRQLLAAIQGSQDAVDDFVSVQAGTLAAPAFFAPENVERMFAAASAAATAA
jgi:flavin-dependent dehydrogenase